MKRIALAAALGVALIGAAAYVLGSGDQASSSAPARSIDPTATRATVPPSPPGAGIVGGRQQEPVAPAAAQPSTARDAVEAQPQPSSQANVTAPVAEDGSRALPANADYVPRTGESSLRLPAEGSAAAPTFEGEAGVAHQRHLREKVEAAACNAPNSEARYANLPAAEAQRLRERCAALTGTPAKKPAKPERPRE